MYLEIINNLCDGVYFVNNKRRITFWNKAAENITGYKAEEVIGKSCHRSLLNHIDKNGSPLCIVGCPLYASLADGNHRSAELFVRHKDGHRLPIHSNFYPIKEKGEIIGVVEVFTQNSPLVYDDHLIENLSNLATKDQLTGLYNRRNIESFMNFRLNELRRFGRKFCVTFLDIDDFSNFNNTYGHEAGDHVLKLVSKSIMCAARKTDLFGRWGGEEFICVSEISNENEAAIIAEKIRLLISSSMLSYEDKKLSVTASLGTTVAVENDTVDSIIRRADMLMYRSKKKGKNCVTTDANIVKHTKHKIS